MTPLKKAVRRLCTIGNGSGSGHAWRSDWIVSLEPSIRPYISFRLPRKRSVYTMPLEKVLDQAEHAAASDLMRARKANRMARRAAAGKTVRA
jgi:hypothetical protein